MAMTTEQVVDEALQKSAEERGMIAAKLIASLDLQEDPDAEAAWQAEVTRRVRELDEGTAKTVPWEEAKARVSKAIHAVHQHT